MKKKFRIKKIFKNSIFTFILGIFLTSVIGVGATTLLYSKDVNYDNSSSGMSSTTVQDALDELYEQASSAGGCPEGYICTSTVYVYAFNENEVKIGTSTLTDLGTSYATFAEAVASNSNSGGVIALKYAVENNVLTAVYACFLKDGEEYCLKGDDTEEYANNVEILNTAFPTCGASASGSSASCSDASVGAFAGSSGNVYTELSSSYWSCYISGSYSYAYCGVI